MMKFFEYRIADRRMLRLLQKWLSAGVLHDGKWTASEEGTPQGATVSPLAANVYLHYVLDLWVQQWRSRNAHGDVIVVRFADDFLVGFERKVDAERFLGELRERLSKFSLELHADKTRLVEFGRFAASNRSERNLGKPETFAFLGFTHICGKTRTGRFMLRRHTIRKRLTAKLHEVKAQLQRRRHDPIPEQGRWLGSVVRGHTAYYAVPGNVDAVRSFRSLVIRHWQRELRQRSQKHRMTWQRMSRLANRWLPPACTMHSFPEERFSRQHPR